MPEIWRLFASNAIYAPFFDRLRNTVTIMSLSLFIIGFFRTNPLRGLCTAHVGHFPVVQRLGRPKRSATRSMDTYSPRLPAGSRASTTMPPAPLTIL